MTRQSGRRMKLRRPEFRRARKIRQRARKRQPVVRWLKRIYAEPIFQRALSDIVLHGALSASFADILDRSREGGRYIENSFHYEVQPRMHD